MNYFTPELLAKSRSSNGDVAQHAAERWEQAIAAYSKRLTEIRATLPLGARRLLKHVSLHDAQCLTIKTSANGRGKELFLTFRLAGSPTRPGGGVELRYSLDGRSTLLPDKARKLADGPATPHVLYDEFALEQKRGAKVFTHSLLLTGGLEFRIRFSNLRLKWFGKALLANSKPAEIEKEWAGDDLLATT